MSRGLEYEEGCLKMLRCEGRFKNVMTVHFIYKRAIIFYIVPTLFGRCFVNPTGEVCESEEFCISEFVNTVKDEGIKNEWLRLKEILSVYSGGKKNIYNILDKDSDEGTHHIDVVFENDGYKIEKARDNSCKYTNKCMIHLVRVIFRYDTLKLFAVKSNSWMMYYDVYGFAHFSNNGEITASFLDEYDYLLGELIKPIEKNREAKKLFNMHKKFLLLLSATQEKWMKSLDKRLKEKYLSVELVFDEAGNFEVKV